MVHVPVLPFLVRSALTSVQLPQPTLPALCTSLLPKYNDLSYMELDGLGWVALQGMVQVRHRHQSDGELPN